MSKPLNILSLIKENLGNETAQACLKLVHYKSLLHKLFWLVCLLVCNGFCGFIIVKLLIDYFSYETFTSSKTIFELPTLFPKIIICNNNQFTTKEAYEFLKTLSKQSMPETNIFNQTQLIKMNSTEKYNAIMELYLMANSEIFSKNFTQKDRKKLGQSLDDFLIECTFNGENCSPERDFVWKFDLYCGNCYVFNSGVNEMGERVELKRSYLGGYRYGLNLKVNIRFYKELSLINSLFGSGGKFNLNLKLSNDYRF